MSDAKVIAQILAKIEREADAGRNRLSISEAMADPVMDVISLMGYQWGGIDDMTICWMGNSGGAEFGRYGANGMCKRANEARVRIAEARLMRIKDDARAAIALLESWKKEGA